MNVCVLVTQTHSEGTESMVVTVHRDVRALRRHALTAGMAELVDMLIRNLPPGGREVGGSNRTHEAKLFCIPVT